MGGIMKKISDWFKDQFQKADMDYNQLMKELDQKIKLHAETEAAETDGLSITAAEEIIKRIAYKDILYYTLLSIYIKKQSEK